MYQKLFNNPLFSDYRCNLIEILQSKKEQIEEILESLVVLDCLIAWLFLCTAGILDLYP